MNVTLPRFVREDYLLIDLRSSVGVKIPDKDIFILS